MGLAVACLPWPRRTSSGGGIGRAHERREQRCAVRVTPLCVVDPDHQGRAGGHAPEALAQCRERAAPKLVGFGQVLDATGQRGDLLHARQDREDAREGRDVSRQERGRVGRGQRAQVPRERLDDAVERVERDRLARVAAPREHDCARLLDEPAGEAGQQRRLSHAGLAPHLDHHRAALRDRSERGLEALELRLASEQRHAVDAPGRLRRPEEALQDLCARRALLRFGLQQVRTERVEVCGDARRELARRPELPSRRVAGAWKPRTERQASAHGLVQSDAEPVPVARFGECGARGLLRGHVRGRSGPRPRARHRPAGAGLGRARLALRGIAHELPREPEVGNPHAPVVADQQVLRLDVAVDEARGVRGREAFPRLPEHPEDLRQRPGVAREPGAKGASYDELHGHEQIAVEHAHVVHRDDVRVRQLGQRLGLPLQAGPRAVLALAGLCREQLERDLAAEDRGRRPRRPRPCRRRRASTAARTGRARPAPGLRRRFRRRARGRPAASGTGRTRRRARSRSRGFRSGEFPRRSPGSRCRPGRGSRPGQSTTLPRGAPGMPSSPSLTSTLAEHTGLDPEDLARPEPLLPAEELEPLPPLLPPEGVTARRLRDVAERVRALQGCLDLAGIRGSAGAAVVAAIARQGRKVVLVSADLDVSRRSAEDVGFLARGALADDAEDTGEGEVLVFAGQESSPYADVNADRRAAMSRMATLFHLAHDLPLVGALRARERARAQGRAPQGAREARRPDRRRAGARPRRSSCARCPRRVTCACRSSRTRAASPCAARSSTCGRPRATCPCASSSTAISCCR